PVIASRKSFPLWVIILGVLGVAAVLGVTIGLLVHFLVVENKIYYYQGSFKVLNIPYDRNYERETSPESNYLSKILETNMVDAFQNSNIYRQYINSQIITLAAGDDQECQQPMTESREVPLLRKENGHGKRVSETNNPKNLSISFGTAVTPPYMQHYVQEVIIHENYVKGEHHDDIAVIVLTEKVLFKNDVHRVCLPEATQIFPPGEGVVVTGWGALSHNESAASQAQLDKPMHLQYLKGCRNTSD
ncbi:hypothetical protein A6R68_13458, partial [Neotoma lepida]